MDSTCEWYLTWFALGNRFKVFCSEAFSRARRSAPVTEGGSVDPRETGSRVRVVGGHRGAGGGHVSPRPF